MKRVLVLDANQRSALAVTRSLGNRAIPLVTADECPVALAGCSRYSGKYYTYPSPALHPGRFVDTIVDICESQHIEVILPMTELTTTLLLRNCSRFNDAILPFPAIDAVDALADKCTLMKLALSLGVPTPETRHANSSAGPGIDLNRLPYPVVLKPGKSWLESGGRWFHTRVRYAGSAQEAAAILGSDPSFHGYPYMVQDYVPGTGQGIFALYNRGKPVTFFAHRRLREKPPQGGVSVLSESIPINPELLSYAQALLDKAAWHGIAMVEFKVDSDGTPFLMEINTRFWGSLQLAIDAGIDFPFLLYQAACNEPPDPVSNYKTGIRLRWLLGDLDSLYLTLRNRSYTFSRKLFAVLQFMRPSLFRNRHEVNRLSDPGPAWCELKQYTGNIFR